MNRRGVSEVVGVFLMTLIVMGIAAAWLTLEAPRISRESMGIVEALRAAARRQRQLLSLFYYKTDESALKLRIYIYNYGFGESRIIGEKAGLKIEKARQICRAARELLQIRPKTIAELIREEKQKICISTGSAAIDNLLGRGNKDWRADRVSGPYGVGKTAMVLTVAVNVVKGLGAGALLIDTEGAMSVSRILNIAEARGLRWMRLWRKFYSLELTRLSS